MTPQNSFESLQHMLSYSGWRVVATMLPPILKGLASQSLKDLKNGIAEDVLRDVTSFILRVNLST